MSTNKSMTHEELQMLKTHRLSFERACLDIIKQDLKKINSSLSQAEKAEKKERKREREIKLLYV